MSDQGELSITSNGITYTGWSSIEVVRSIEQFPSHFVVQVTEHDPATPSNVVLAPQDPVVVKLGDDLVLTGYVDDVEFSIGPGLHTVTIIGRSKCEDLHDSSANISGMTLNRVSLTALATQLAAPYGITVNTLTSSLGVGTTPGANSQPPPTVIPAFQINLSETPYEIIERVARWVGIGWLVYDGTDGNLILSTVGTQTMASGLKEGVNVQEAKIRYTMAERYSEYIGVLNSVYGLSDVTNSASDITAQHVYDLGVKRYRPLILTTEGFIGGVDLTNARITWECNRRAGRSQVLQVKADSWRDAATGKLWEPNWLVSCNFPSLKITNQLWLIASVFVSPRSPIWHACRPRDHAKRGV